MNRKKGRLPSSFFAVHFYCIKKHPAILCCVPSQLLGAIRYQWKQIDKVRFKESFYCFFKKIPDIIPETKKFWDDNERKIGEWYKTIYHSNDVVISASPDFLIREMCNRLNIGTIIASRVNPINGEYDGLNCYGEEKVRRFYEIFPNGIIDRFYSDSESDIPLARIAKECYLVKNQKIQKWIIEK